MTTVGRTTQSNVAGEPRPHRLAVVIVKAARGQDGVRILADLSGAAGAAGSTLRTWCRVARLYPHDVVAFTRALFAIYNALQRDVEPNDLLDFAEQRSLERFLGRSGQLAEGGQTVSVPTFCARQLFIDHRQIVADVIRLMAEEQPTKNKRA
jgi:hypothetical protein